MKLYGLTKKGRANHPIVSKFPERVWIDFLNYELTSFETRWMTASPSERSDLLRMNSRASDDKKRHCWVSIAFTESTLDDSELINIANVMKLSPEHQLQGACIIGRAGIAKLLLEQLPLEPDDTEASMSLIMKAFRMAASYGHLDVMKTFVARGYTKSSLWDKLCEVRWRDDVFIKAIENGHAHIILELLTWVPEAKAWEEMQAGGLASPFIRAASAGLLDVVKELLRLAPTAEQRIQLVREDTYEAFKEAYSHKHFEVIEELYNQISDANERSSILERNCAQMLMNASKDNVLYRFNSIMTLIPIQKYCDKLKVPYCNIFERILVDGNALVVQAFLNRLPDSEFGLLIRSNGYKVFKSVAEKGRVDMMDMILARATEADRMAMLLIQDTFVFLGAASRGDCDVVRTLLNKEPGLIRCENYLGIIRAINGGNYPSSEDGHYPVVKTILDMASPTDKLAMLRANNYFAFNLIRERENFEIFKELLACLPKDEARALIQQNQYARFIELAKNGFLHIINEWMRFLPEEVSGMIEASNFAPFRAAAANGQLEVMEKLISCVSPTRLNAMISSDSFGSANYGALDEASQNGELLVIDRLLSFPCCFIHAEQHMAEYGLHVNSIINKKLTTLRTQRQTVETANPLAVFDITDPESARLYFYIIRNLIRRNDPTLLDDLRFLLEIPSVKTLAHTAVTPNQPNELVRLALTTGNLGAAEILLNIPTVRELAEQNDFYQNEARGELNLRDLARDQESSMRALTTGEQERLEKAIKHYQPVMQETGIEPLFNKLREQLIERYQRHPAKIEVDGKDILLPVEWEEFKKLTLTPEQYQEALKSYYQHKDHTALRYLSRPNLWMAPNSEFVVVNPNNTEERWSTFEEYKNLIVMLWCAAKDENTPAVDGHTLEGRIDHFIDELAHLGRAHNWDHSRVKTDKDGNPIVNQSGENVEEYYDDLRGDKPSCYSGVKSRLFQSVVGHPLLKILTLDDITQELRDFVRAHFISLINDRNRESLAAALNKCVIDQEFDDTTAVLKDLDITSKQQEAFIHALKMKYDPLFSRDIRFVQYINGMFALKEGKGNDPDDYAHALKLLGLTGLEQLLRQPISVSGLGLFSRSEPASAGESQLPIPSDDKHKPSTP